MDTAKAITHVSLCAGYGGIDLGLKRAVPNLRTVAFSEIEAFACANLVAKMEAGCLDAAPIWTDVKTFPWASFHGKVDILSGGYPCQPFSAAGKRLGKDDPRHLWPWIADGIRAMQPGLCFFENVEGHISLGLGEVIGELERLGYRTTWGLFSAAEVGAPHQRKRIFIMAHLSGTGLEGYRWNIAGAGEAAGRGEGDERNFAVGGVCGNVWPSRPGQPQHEWEPPRVVGDADHGRQSSRIYAGSGAKAIGRGQSDAEQADSGLADSSGIDGSGRGTWTRGRQRSECHAGIVQSEGNGDGQTEPALGGDADGAAHRLDDAELYVTSDNRTDELRLLGNGVVPATAERAFRTLINRFP
jgi:DNA (cytosine-5)-methyltransferase 1